MDDTFRHCIACSRDSGTYLTPIRTVSSRQRVQLVRQLDRDISEIIYHVHLHCVYLKWLQLAIAEFVDPWDRSQTKVNHQIQDIIAVDFDAISVMLLAVSTAAGIG